jgi:hypothetical protein
LFLKVGRKWASGQKSGQKREENALFMSVHPLQKSHAQIKVGKSPVFKIKVGRNFTHFQTLYVRILLIFFILLTHNIIKYDRN